MADTLYLVTLLILAIEDKQYLISKSRVPTFQGSQFSTSQNIVAQELLLTYATRAVKGLAVRALRIVVLKLKSSHSESSTRLLLLPLRCQYTPEWATRHRKRIVRQSHQNRVLT